MPLHYLYFNYLTTLQANTQNNLGFSHTLLAAHAVWPNTQNWAWFGSQISAICCELSGGRLRPPNPPPVGPWTPLGDFCPTDYRCAPYLQILATPLPIICSARRPALLRTRYTNRLDPENITDIRNVPLPFHRPPRWSGPCLAGVRLTRKALDGFKNRITNWSANDA